ncbi:endonuclease/exonuclease/phosphatase family protein [Sphingopyxis sp. 550A]
MKIWSKSRLTLLLLLVAAWTTPARAGEDRCAAPILAMTYNIRLDTAADGQNSWPHRRNFLISQIEMLRPALLGMQEVLPNQRADLQSALTGYAFVGGGRDDGKLAGEASPIAIDRRVFRIENSGTFWLSPTPSIPSTGWDAAYPRIVTWARLRYRRSKTRVLVVNTHWDHVGREARTESGQQLARWLQDTRSGNDAVIMLGDFNTDSDDPAVADMLQLTGLRSAQEAASSTSAAEQPSTFNRFEAQPPAGQVIDHIFVSERVAVWRSMVIAQHLNGRVPSDHFPFAALLKLPSKQRGKGCS